MTMSDGEKNDKKIVIQWNGPYEIYGDIPLVRKTQIVSEHGEPLAWKKEGAIPTQGMYQLCRCGHSGDKPFCDSTHREIDFDGTETVDINPAIERRITYPGSKQIIVRKDGSICSQSGFCANRLFTTEQLVSQTADPQIRALVMAFVENCPSGSLSYSLAGNEVDIEPDLPQQIAITTEMTDNGPINGPLWVTGNISIEFSDGRILQGRNRVTLCRCGLSKNKPFCDGTHRPQE